MFMRRPGPSAVPIQLTDAERALLYSLTAQASLASRAKIVLACAEPGASNAEVARELGMSVATVRRWRTAFAEGGTDALLDRPRTGRPKAELTVSDQERATLRRWARRAK